MIHAIGEAIQTRLRARGCPVRVVDGPELPTTTFGNERVVIEYSGGNTFGPPLSQHKNPKHVGDLIVGAKITIYAQSPKAGALFFEHQRRALQIFRQVIVALTEELRGEHMPDGTPNERRCPLKVEGGDFFVPADLAKSETLGGVAYAFTFAFRTGVPTETWTGDARPEATLADGMMTSTTRVHGTNTVLGPGAETGCGE